MSSSRPPALSRRCSAGVVALVVAGLMCSSASAQSLPEGSAPPDYVKSSVAIVHQGLPLYLNADAPALPGQLNRDHLFKAFRRYLAAHPYLDLTPTSEALQRISRRPDIATSRHEAEQRRGIGEMHYFNLDVANAIPELQKARDLYLEGLGELLVGDEMARTYQYLAFAQLDKAYHDPARVDADALLEAQEAMRQMVRVAPGIVLDASRQPPERVDLYRQARDQYLSEPALRRVDPDQARRIAKHMGVDFLLYLKLVQTDDGSLIAEMEVFDRKADTLRLEQVVVHASEEVQGDFEHRVQERIEALASRFASCVQPKPAPTDPHDDLTGRLSFNTGFIYFIYAEDPTTEPFDNMGASFRIAYMLTDHFAALARVGLAFSGTDQRGELRSPFNTLRASLGIALSANFKYIHPYVSSGLEVAKPTTSFVVAKDLACRAYGLDDPQCENYEVFDVAVLAGVTGSAGVSVGLDPVFVYAEASAAFYVLPFEGEKLLNFPLGFDVGLEYRF